MDPALMSRGAENGEWWAGPHVLLYASRDAWECAPHLAGTALVAHHDGVVVVADASLYYRAQLLRDLAHAKVAPLPDGASAAELILASYRAWGFACAEHLEGDFAFILWNVATQRAIIARDHVGRRPLFHGEGSSGEMILGSVARVVARHAALGAAVNRCSVAAAIGGLLGGSLETGFEGVTAVPAGATMTWTPFHGLRQVEQWTPPTFAFGGRGHDFAEASLHLRDLLTVAAAERSADPLTGVWLSGGADSTAVFGAAQRAHAERGTAPIQAVSVSYPTGDGAREDEHILALTQQWGAPVRWIDSESVPLFSGLEERARLRDDPYAHTYEQMNRALARETAQSGARVTFDGYGGDQLFQVSDAFLGDLLVRLRWTALLHGLRQLQVTDLKGIVRSYVIPFVPRPIRDALASLRGPGSLRVQMEQTLPEWLSPSILHDERLRRRANAEPERNIFEGLSTHESRWYLSSPYFGRAVAWATAFALGEGVEVRSPLLDSRVIRFAATRPVSERVPLEGSKKLLREASRGLVPESVRAPRKFKTGIPKGYFHRQMQAGFAQAFERVFGTLSAHGPTLRLADLGIVDRSRLAQAKADYERTADHLTGVRLFLTLQAELWLRSLS